MLTLIFGSRLFISVPAGHTAVATLFGEVQEIHFKEGLTFPVNPLYEFEHYDVRENTLMEKANVPSQDQQITEIDVSVQYRLIGELTPTILRESGSTSRAVQVHLIPKLRSTIREQGKTVKRAEDFFNEETQENLQISILDKLREYLQPIGIHVKAVLIRDIRLPASLRKAIEEKKEREQAVEKEKAELELKSTEFQQVVKQAESERAAAEQDAEKRRVLADAQAYEIQKLNEAISSNPAYVQLQALEALKEISKDPSTKIYFIDSQSSSPLPLMNIGDPLIKK